MEFANEFIYYVLSIIEYGSYLGIFCIIALEYACFPLPSEAILPFVGLSIAHTSLSFIPAVIISILAGLLGSIICYAIGKYSTNVFLTKINAHSKENTKCIHLLHHWFESYGKWAVSLSRIIPLTRTYISFFAGTSNMAFSPFLLYSSFGICIWNIVLITLGYMVGENWTYLQKIISTYQSIIICAALLFIICISAYQLLKKYSFLINKRNLK